MTGAGGPTLPAREAVLLFVAVALLLLGSAAALAPLGVLGVVISEVVVVGGPTLLLASRLGGPATLGLVRPRARHVAGAALIGLSLWYLLAWLVLPLQERVAPTPPELREALERIAVTPAPLWQPLLFLAVVPAVCEELLCRGVLARALAVRIGPTRAVLVSAALFALLHMSPYRLVPTFLLGLSLGAITLASGSVIPAMVLHALNNAAILLEANLNLVPEHLAVGAVALGMAVAGHTLFLLPIRSVE